MKRKQITLHEGQTLLENNVPKIIEARRNKTHEGIYIHFGACTQLFIGLFHPSDRKRPILVVEEVTQ